MKNNINIKHDATNKILHMILAGRLDVAGAQALETEFNRQIEQAVWPVLVDMANVEFLGSMGIRLILAGAKSLQQRGLKMALLKPSALVEETWYSAGLADIIPIEHNPDFAFNLS